MDCRRSILSYRLHLNFKRFTNYLIAESDLLALWCIDRIFRFIRRALIMTGWNCGFTGEDCVFTGVKRGFTGEDYAFTGVHCGFTGED